MTANLALEIPSAPLRLAVLQVEARSGDLAGNVFRASKAAEKAARQGARVAVLPELYLCGYDLPTLERAPEACQLVADDQGVVTDERLAPLAAEAEASRLLVLTGAAVRKPDGTLTNSLLSVDRSGIITVAYDKRHLWHADEARMFTAGREEGVLRSVDGWQLGLAICYDMSFPEHARSTALSGAHAYVCPSAFVVGAHRRATTYMPARALENTVYSVYANAVGGPISRQSGGGSAVYTPDGTLVDGASPSTEDLLLADLEPGQLAQARDFLHMLAECHDDQAQHAA